MKRWFVKGKDNVATRRTLGTNAQQLKTSLGPRPGGGGRGAASKGGVSRTARPDKKVKAPGETWYQPSFFLRRQVTAA